MKYLISEHSKQLTEAPSAPIEVRWMFLQYHSMQLRVVNTGVNTGGGGDLSPTHLWAGGMVCRITPSDFYWERKTITTVQYMYIQYITTLEPQCIFIRCERCWDIFRYKQFPGTAGHYFHRFSVCLNFYWCAFM